ncbi:membrane hypothetical protein [[Clostridium] ultunense Esp]|nr:membrane hypothetical protein [[Clostridium] ultunense Esp]
MLDVLQFGSLMIRLDWLLMGVSGIAGYGALKHALKKSAFADRPLPDKLLNAFIIAFLVWKLSPLLYAPSLLWTFPLGVLIMPGNTAGVWLGAGAALLYMDRALWTMKIPRLFFADLMALGWVTAMLVYSLLDKQYGTTTHLPWGISLENPDFRYHPVNIYIFLVTLPMWIWLWRKSSVLLGTGNMILNVLIYYGMGLMLVSIFKTKTSAFYGLSREQILYLLMITTGWILSVFLERTNRRKRTPAVDSNQVEPETGRD